MTTEKRTNQWIEHCKAYAKENGCSYKIAIKESKASYVPISKVEKPKVEQQVEPEPEPEPEPEVLVVETVVKKPRKPKVKKE